MCLMIVDIHIKYCLNFHCTHDSFFKFLCFSVYKTVDSVYSVDMYKSVKQNIEKVMRNPKMLKFVLDHRKTKKICKHVLKNYLI